ncbi:MAG: alginate lyase family protein [bacterium]|nr:alginate lyase family protein [bacterium]
MGKNEGKNFYFTDLKQLEFARAHIHEKKFQEALKLLTVEAEQYLKIPIQAVTDKILMPLSNDKHDYVSLAKYRWPNPDTKDGLPYIRRDGEVNPEVEKYDVKIFTDFSQAVQALSFAYFYTGKEKFALRAIEWLNTWFINPDTRMNPHFEYAQFIPGEEHKGHGIIEGNRLRRLPDSIALLGFHISNEEMSSIRAWFGQMARWLTTSEKGVYVANMQNNQAVWQAEQVALYSDFSTDSTGEIKEIFERARKLIDDRIDNDGSMPNELMRTRSLHYHFFTLLAFIDLATMAKMHGIDLFNYKSPKNAGIRTTLEFLIPYITKLEIWSHEQITPIHWPLVVEILRRSAYAYQEARYEEITNEIPKSIMKDVVSAVEWIDLILPPYSKN